MKDDNAFFVECPFIDFLRIFPQFVNIIDDSTLNEFMKSNLSLKSVVFLANGALGVIEE